VLAASASAIPQFSSPQTLSPAGQDAYYPQVATDGSGRATIVWQRTDGTNKRVQSVRLAADGTPEPVQTLSHPGQSARIPQVALDGSDRATIAWQRSDGSNIRIQSVRLAADGTPGPVQTLSDPGQNARFPQVALDRSGRATITWQRNDGAYYRVQSVRLAADGTLEPVQTLSDPGRSAINPQVAIDGSDRATITWQPSDIFDGSVQSVRLAADGTPGPVQSLSAAGQGADRPQVAIDGSDRATIVWTGSDGANARIRSVRLAADGTAEPVQTLSGAGEHASRPQVAIDNSGRTTIVWCVGGCGGNVRADTRIQSVRLSADGTPGAVQTLSDAGPDTLYPQVAMDGSDRATVTWYRYDGSDYRIQSVRLAADGTPGPVRTLSDPGQDAFIPQVAIDSFDRATITWYRYDGSRFRIRSITLDTDLKGSATAKKTQKQKGKKIVVKANVSAGEDLSATGKGKIKVAKRSYKLKKASKSVSSGKSKNLKLKPKKSKHAKKIAKALKRGKKAKAKLTVKLTDEAGNKRTTKLSVAVTAE